MIEIGITLGLIFSLLAYEVFGLAAGGIVVPGYIALQLAHPERLVGVFVVSLITFLIIKAISYYTFMYGRRQMVLSILIMRVVAMSLRGQTCRRRFRSILLKTLKLSR